MSTTHRFFALALLSSTLGIGCLATGESPADIADEEEMFDEADAALYGPGEIGEVVYDGPGRPTFTRCEGNNNMHCCPPGFAMAGIHVGDNLFRCVRTIAPNNVAARQVCEFDGSPYKKPTVGGSRLAGTDLGYSSHVCRDQYYMRGISVSSNTYLCCEDSNQLFNLDRIADFGTSDGIMHACPLPTATAKTLNVMSGFHLAMNMLGCTPYPNNL